MSNAFGYGSLGGGYQACAVPAAAGGGGAFPTAVGSAALPAWHFVSPVPRNIGMYAPASNDRISVVASGEDIQEWTDRIVVAQGSGTTVQLANVMIPHVAVGSSETAALYINVDSAVTGGAGDAQTHGIYIELSKQASPLIDGTAIKVVTDAKDDAIYVEIWGSDSVGYEASTNAAGGNRGFIGTKQLTSGQTAWSPFVALWRPDGVPDETLLETPDFGLFHAQLSPGRSFLHQRHGTVIETLPAFLIAEHDYTYHRFEVQNNGQINIYAEQSDVTTTFVDAPIVQIVGSYWDGAASANLAATIRHNMLSNAPTSRLEFQIGASIIMHLDGATLDVQGSLIQDVGNITMNAATTLSGFRDLTMENAAGGTFDMQGGVIVDITALTAEAGSPLNLDLQSGILDRVGDITMEDGNTLLGAETISMDPAGTGTFDMQGATITNGGNFQLVGSITGVTELFFEAGASDPSIQAGTADPSTAAGVAALDGSLYLRYVLNAGTVWAKTGSANTAWTDITAGVGGGTTHASSTDNRVARYDGTAAIQGSGIAINDTDDISGVNDLSMAIASTLSGFRDLTMDSGAGGTFDMQGGAIVGITGLTAQAATPLHIDMQGGALSGVGSLTMSSGGGITMIGAGSLDMQAGTIVTCGSITMQAATTLSGLKHITLQAGAGGTFDMQTGTIVNISALTAQAATPLNVDLQSGNLVAVADATIDEIFINAGASDPSILGGTVDPSAAAGVAALDGSIYLRYVLGAGTVWVKTGTADTAWTDITGWTDTVHAASSDNRIARYNGTDGIQGSGVTVDDSDNVTGVANLTMDAASTLSGLKFITLQTSTGSQMDFQTGKIINITGITALAATALNIDVQGGNITAVAALTMTGTFTCSGAMTHTGTTWGIHSAGAQTQRNITGARAGNAALANLLTAGAQIGLWTDSTT